MQSLDWALAPLGSPLRTSLLCLRIKDREPRLICGDDLLDQVMILVEEIEIFPAVCHSPCLVFFSEDLRNKLG